MPILDQRLPTFRAVFRRHIAARAPRKRPHFFRFEIDVVAVFTIIMGRQRIHFGNTRHRRDKRRTDRSARTDEIAVLVRLPHEFLGDDVHDGKSVFYNRIQFMVQPPLSLRRQRVAVHTDRLLITDVPQRLIGMRYDRRTLIGIYRRHFFEPVSNQVRICHNDFVRLLLS